MSENIPESIPTSAYRQPAKRARTDGPTSQQGSKIDALFANPDKALEVPLGPASRTLEPPPEIVTNVQGSSAGAGSGEFHVYKASRRREYERMRAMDEEVETEKADKEWQERQQEMKSKDDAKLSKNRARREKQKARQAKAKSGPQQDGTDGDVEVPQLAKKKMVPANVPTSNSSAKTEQDGSNGAAIEEDGITFLEDG